MNGERGTRGEKYILLALEDGKAMARAAVIGRAFELWERDEETPPSDNALKNAVDSLLASGGIVQEARDRKLGPAPFLRRPS